VAHCRTFDLVEHDAGRCVRNCGLKLRQATHQPRHTNCICGTYGKNNIGHFQAAQRCSIPTRSQGIEAEFFIGFKAETCVHHNMIRYVPGHIQDR
jgi:hypothetical protein